MFIKTKIGIVALILAAFVVGGFAFNAYQAGAFRGGGFFFGKDFGAREEWREMTPEERQAKMEEFKANMPERPENGEWEGRGLGFGHFGFKGMKEFVAEINRDIIILDNGIQITITSDNPDVVQKLHNFAKRIIK